MKFKVGDKVKVINCSMCEKNCSNYGKVGKIIKIDYFNKEYPYILDIDLTENWKDEELELVLEKPKTVIDLLNLIAENKPVPKKFKIGKVVFRFYKGYYYDDESGSILQVFSRKDLIKEIEILNNEEEIAELQKEADELIKKFNEIKDKIRSLENEI